MMSANLKKCMPLIKSYCKIRSPKEKKKYLKQYEACIMKAVQEMSLNTLNGNVAMNPGQKRRLRRYKDSLIALSKHSVPRAKKRKIILQRGSGLLAVLLPLVAQQLISILSK